MIITHHNGKKIPELEIKNLDKEIAEKFSLLIQESKVKSLASKIEVWTSSESNKSLAYLSHGIFRYFGKFPPPIARYLIQTYTKEKDLVIDPMCGSGTTGLESLILNRRAECYDINPLSVLLSKVKITKLDKNSYLNTLEKILEEAKKKRTVKKQSLIGLRNPEHWFLPETAESLSKIKNSIEDCEASTDIKDALLIAFLGIVRRVSRATTQQGRLFLDVVTAEKDALPFFEKKAREMIESLSQLPENKDKVKIFQKSILDEEKKLDGDTKLIICHPPYFNSYKYSGVNSLELAWLGIDHATVRKNEVRESFKVGKASKVTEYVEDMEKGLRNLRPYLKKGGYLALMIGDTVMQGKYIPVTKSLIDKLKDVYKIERVALRIPKFTEASWAASQRRTGTQVGVNLCDLIVILQKI